ncbi:50S ribosomal protein L24 [Agrococcus jejuensis]|uniref:Large ribosomal subunit protein uL24 n=1 Tax=Agrococcus jejuensis TaxID=399736 RepID=A0A1G8BP39_9MICO|nr:50S ribosomal protein L24 [Agrococcus jejuensis]SDH34834.1 LSU ribosomal protein L24P [Agrococcus jejuensis]
MANIKKGDTVQVIAGARESRGGDRGKTGRVLEVLNDGRVIVEGVKLVKKHIKVGQTQRGTKTGGIETHESPIHVSNVALIDPETKKPTRVRSSITKVEKDGVQVTTKVRVSTRSGKEIKSND